MEEYKRVTNPEWKEHYDLFENCYNCEIDCGACELNYTALIRLAELEDKIEKRRLIELPCKIGDAIYFVYENENICLDEGKVVSFSIDETNLLLYVKYNSGLTYWHTALELGHMLFLTKEEAKAKIKELSSEE